LFELPNLPRSDLAKEKTLRDVTAHARRTRKQEMFQLLGKEEETACSPGRPLTVSFPRVY